MLTSRVDNASSHSDSTSSPDHEALYRTVSDIEARITANHANTLAFIACLRACTTKTPYREVEAHASADSAFGLCMQSAHTLCEVLVDCGALLAINADKKSNEGFEISENPAVNDPEDQPIDYYLLITEAGAEVLDRFEPTQRLARLIAGEPPAYHPAYLTVLSACASGASLADINAALADDPALYHPKRIYPEYFVSKLETNGGIAWKRSWSTTEAGKTYLDQQAHSVPCFN